MRGGGRLGLRLLVVVALLLIPVGGAGMRFFNR